MVRTGRLRTSDRRTRLLGRGAKQCGEHVPESFTALFTARDGGVPVGSAAGCGPFPTCYRSHKLLGRSRGHGRDLERRQFSPVKTEVISNTLDRGYTDHVSIQCMRLMCMSCSWGRVTRVVCGVGCGAVQAKNGRLRTGHCGLATADWPLRTGTGVPVSGLRSGGVSRSPGRRRVDFWITV